MKTIMLIFIKKLLKLKGSTVEPKYFKSSYVDMVTKHRFIKCMLHTAYYKHAFSEEVNITTSRVSLVRGKSFYFTWGSANLHIFC